MTKRNTIIFSTVVAWLIGVGVYAYYWAMSLLDEYSGKPGGLLPLLGFFVYRFPYLLAGLVILIIAELIFIPGSHGRPGKMV
ncbi:MAG: hypothetical protein QOH63_2364 [Acidobacteriota bacterium]|jgi:hypothetical protein|nr:hypothetical protein [Acidobacteriota bacterium]